jgi:GNAT superfamily N-acetyltransferase
MSFEIKRITAADAALFDNIAPAVFDEPIHPERLLAYLADPNTMMVLAFDGALVVGQCAGVIHRHPDKTTELYVDEVGTASTHLRQGIATAMLNALFAWGRELGCTEAWLGTELDNVEANGLYAKVRGKGDTIRYYEWDLFAQDDPDGVDQAGEIAEQRQEDVEPEMQAEPDLQEDAQGRDDHRQDDA